MSEPNAPRANASRNAWLAGGAAVLALASPFIAAWEGGRQRDGSAIAYADRLAGGLPTACEGVTGRDHLGRTIVVGTRYTAEECNVMLRQELVRRLGEIRPCFKADAPAEAVGAGLSLAYNIGTPAFLRSSACRHFRAGNYAAACDAFLLWNRASGRVVQGLVNRRRAERTLCLRGLNAQ